MARALGRGWPVDDVNNHCNLLRDEVLRRCCCVLCSIFQREVFLTLERKFFCFECDSQDGFCFLHKALQEFVCVRVSCARKVPGRGLPGCGVWLF